MENEDRFIPGTIERNVAKNIVFRPIKMWHSGTFAGEKLEKIPGSEDHSGCMRKVMFKGHEWEMCPLPYTVTHRWYWHKKNQERTISAFLSYPNAMGCSDRYFWEIYPYKGDVGRFDNEKEMEKSVIRILNNWERKRKVKK